MDIILSITIQRPPRHLALWRHILGNSQGVDLYMLRFAGCSDAVLLMLGEIAALSQWKSTEMQRGSMNMRHLFERADAIGQLLQQNANPALSGAPFGRQTQADDQIFMVVGGRSISPGIDEQACRRLVSQIWWEATSLYLSTVVHGSSPGEQFMRITMIASESCINTASDGMMNRVAAIVQRLAALPATGLDRALVAPLMLTAAVANDAEHRTVLLTRLVNIDGSSANVRQAEAILRDVWRRRDAGMAAVDWRDVMRENGMTLLLV
jgi:C6 transcription factor Pro1